MALEHRQAALLELLRDRAGAAVSFSELQDAGIEFPASVVSELELAGAPIERCVLRAGDARVTGVRLDPQREPADEHTLALAAAAPARTPRGTAPRTRGRLLSAAWLAPVALLAAALLIAALVPAGGDHGAGVRHRAIAFRARRAAARSGTREAPHAQAVTSQATVPVSAALANQLEAHGHELLEGGRYGDAVQVLTNAVSATGEQPGDCLQPTSETCLTYAYALYDLGRALQLDGRAAAAVPVLQRRLQIDNQRATVAYALESARAQTG